MRTWILLGLLALGLSTAEAQGRRTGRLNLGGATHGGKLHRTDTHRFEVVFTEGAVRVYAYDAEGQPISIRGVRGRANLAVVRATTGGARRGVGHQATGAKLGYQGVSAKQGRLRDCLVGKHSIGADQRQGVRVDVTLTHVADEPEGKVEFRVEFAAGVQEPPQWACDASGCSKTIFVDPGACPKCDGRLKRHGVAERRRQRAVDR